MSQRIWLGGIYLKDEGGYEIVLRSLDHYKKRLKTIDQSPELKGAPMFVQIVQQEAAKSRDTVDQVVNRVKNGLEDSEILGQLQQDIPLVEKALNCYHSDIKKAEGGDKFYSSIIQDMKRAASDLPNIKQALEKINQFA